MIQCHLVKEFCHPSTPLRVTKKSVMVSEVEPWEFSF
jgi:hypothetical protein